MIHRLLIFCCFILLSSFSFCQFTPNSLSNLSLWLSADAGVVTNSNAVTQWNDQSGNGNNCTQATANLRPTASTSATLSNLPVIRFDGTDDILTGNTIANINTSSLTVFVLHSGNSQTGVAAGLFGINTVSSGLNITRGIAVANPRFDFYTNNTLGLRATNNSAPVNGYLPIILGFTRQVGVQARVFINGVQNATSNNATFLSSFTNANYQIGRLTNNQSLNGDIAEIIIYSRILTTIEQQQVENYLMDKYAPPVNLGPDISSNYGFCDFTLTSNAFFQSYSWSTGATTSSISINEPGTYWVQATDIFGRVTTDSVVLTRPHYVEVQLNNQLICYNDPQTINATLPLGDYTFVQWNDGVTTQSRVQGQAQSLFYTVKDSQNCTNSSNTAIITIESSLQAVRLGNDTSLCVGNSIQLAVTSPAITAYSWNTGVTNSSQIIDISGAYVLTVSNANGCIKRDTINIIVLGNAPVLAFNVPPYVCIGSSLNYIESSTVSGATISSVLWNFGNSQTSNQSAGQFDYSQVGDYTGSLLVQSDNGCSSSATFPVSVKSLPIASFTVPLLCSNTPATFTNTSTISVNGGAINLQLWNVENLQVATSNNLTYSFPSAGTYEVELIVENQFGCRDTATQFVNTQAAFAIPSSTSIILPSDNISILVNQPINLTWNAVTNNYFYTIEISSTPNFSIIDFTTTSSVANLTYTPPSLGTYYWRVKTNNACLQGGVSEVKTFTIISVSNTTLWLRGDAGVTSVSGAVSQWNDQSGNGNDATQTTATARPIITNSLQFNNLPVIRFDGSDDILTGNTIANINSSSLTVFVISSGAEQTGIISGLFTINGINNGFNLVRTIQTSTQAFRVISNNVIQMTTAANTASILGYTPKIVTVSKQTGVIGRLFLNGVQSATTTNSTFLNTFINSNYQIGRSNGYSSLNGDIAEVIVYNRTLSTTEQQQVEKYLMDKYAPPVNLGSDINDTYGSEDITLSTAGYFTNYSWSGATTATTATVSINNPGQYILTGTDIFGRLSKDTITITRPDYAAVQLTNQTICYNGNTSITAPMPAGDYTFVQWSDGVTTQTRNISQTANLSYTIKDNANFTRTSNIATFTYDNSLQNVRLGNDTSLCEGNSIQLQVTNPSITSYLWSTNATTPSITLTNSGVYVVEVTNTNSCIKKDTIQITIQGQSPTIQLNFPNQFCQNESASFSESSFVQSSEAIGSRLWNFGNSTSSNLSSGTFLNAVVGNYNGNLIVTSVGGCQSSQAFSYSVRPKPIASYTSPLLCDNVNGLFTNTSTAPSSSITSSQWLVDDVLNASSTNFNYTYPTIGTYNLKLVVTNGFGCKDTSLQNQTVINTYPVPSAPSLIDPFNTKTVLSTEQIPFSWSSVSDNYFYELQFSTTNDFTSILTNQSTTQTNLTTALSTSGTVFWRVKANNPCLLGGTSQIFSLQSVTIADSLRLWLRADQGVTLNGSTVSSWSDQSSNNLNATQSTAANQPTFIASNSVINSLSSIRFDGTNDLLNGGLIPRFGNNSISVFAVTSGGNQNTTNAVMLSSGTVTTGWWFTRRASVGRIGVINNNNTIQGSTTTLPTVGYNFRLFGYNKVLGTSALLKVNGNSEISSTTAAAINGFTNANYQIGAGSGANFLNGDIAEMMVFTKTLSTDEQAGIEKYLMDKYTKPVNIGSDITSNYGFCDFTLTSNAFFQSYVWSTGATTSSITINEPGIYWLEATDIFGRITRDTMVLSRPYYSQIQLNNQLICYNAPQTINATIPSGDYTFVQWNDGVTTQSRVQGQAQSLFYTVKDSQNCIKSSNTAIITIDSSLQAVRLGNDTSLCVGNSIQLAVTSPAITAYSWNTGVTNSSQIIDTAGAYILTVSNANSCFKNDTININVLGNAPVLAFSVPSTVCLGSSFNYSESSTVSGATISNTLWNFGNNQSSNQSAGQFDYSQVGDYTCSLLVQSDNGCSSNASFSISVFPIPIPQIDARYTCNSSELEFFVSNETLLNLTSFHWNITSVGINQNSISAQPTFSITPNSTISGNLVVIDNVGCIGTTSVNIHIPSENQISLVSPANNQTFHSSDIINFTWSDFPLDSLVNHYDVQISNSAGFDLLLYQNQLPTSNLNTALSFNSGTYYWRVKRCNSNFWSTVRTFNVLNFDNSLNLWLRSDSVQVLNGKVIQWYDRSGNNNHAIQNTLSSQPSWINSNTTTLRPSINFDGVDDFLNGSTISGINTSSLSAFILVKGNNQSGIAAGFLTIGNLNQGLWIYRRMFSQRYSFTNNNSSNNLVLDVANSTPNSGFNHTLFGVKKIFNTSSTLYLNGIIGSISNNPSISGSFTNNSYQIGNSSFSKLNGEISEILLFSEALSDGQRNLVEKYVMDRYAPPINLGADIQSNIGFCNITLQPTIQIYTSYLWNTNATSPAISINNPGTYWLEATDIFGRTTRDTIQVFRPVYDSIALQNRIVCYNNLINETAFVPLGYSFVNWNDGNSNPTRLLNQNENLSYTVADTSNCLLTSNIASITIDSSLFAISLGIDTNLCVGNSIELHQTSSSITGYLWNTGNTNPSQTLDTGGVYILEVQNQNNCFNRDSIEITIDGFTPEIVYNFPLENCQFSEVLFSETSTVQGSTIVSTSWTIGNQTPILNSNGQITFNQPVIVPVQLEVVSAQNCRSIDTFSIIVHPKPIVNFATVNYCPYQNIEFNPINLATSELTNYDWNFGQVSSISNTSQLTNPNHFYGIEGTYSVNLKVVDEHGCKDTLIQDVFIQPAPISSFSIQNTCENTLVEFTNTSSIPNGYSIASNIWSYGDNTNAINPTVGKEYTNYGDYTIELIVVGNNGCSDTSSNSITIYPKPVLNWNITPSCKNTLTIFEDLSTIPEGTLVSTDWLVNLQYPFTTPVASYRFATLGVQYLNLTSTSDQNCTSDTLILVNVNPELNANFSYSPINIVAGVPVVFTDLSINSSSSTWDLGIGEEFITYTPPLNQFAKTYPLEWVDSTIDVTLFVENQIGCKDTIIKSFGVQRPAFDLKLKSLFIQEINGFNTIGVEFENKGTIAITSIDFQLTSLNSIPIQETWTGNLLTNQDLIYMFNAKLSANNSTQDDLTNFLCIEGFASDNLGNVDVILENNKVCENTENEEIALISISPNPTETLTNVSLLIPTTSESSKLNVSLYNMSSEIVQYVIDNQVVEPGIFDFNIDFSSLSRGIYLLKIDDGITTKVLRVSKI